VTGTLETGERKWLLERVDDAAVVQLYADGFGKLPLREKTLLWHLCQASLAGRDIYLDQRYRHALLLRELLEETLVTLRCVGPRWEAAAEALAADGVAKATVAELRRYAKLFWLGNGPFHHTTSRKFVLRCERGEFERLVLLAERRGAKLPTGTGETTAALLARVAPVLFDPDHEPMCTSKNPGDGRDLLESSANNLYSGLKLKELDGFQERFGMNSRLVKRADGGLEEEVYRAGLDGLVPPGRCARELNEVIRHLTAAIPFATSSMASALRALIHWLRTGEESAFREYCVAWVADHDSPVDTIQGFVETYMDARGVKASWESLVYFDDPDKMNQIRRFAAHAQWFEDHMPYDDEYRKPQVKGISAKAIQVVLETGDSGPVTPIGINLPNPQDLRERYGSKSVSLGNVVEAYEKSAPVAARREFCHDVEEFERAQKWKPLCDALTTNMHEVIGHASGRSAAHLKGDPSDHLKEYYSALEEARADLVALCFIGDPKLKELGLVEDPAAVERTEFEGYTRAALTQLNRVKEGDQLEEDHMRNRQMIVRWLMAHTNAIEARRRDGKTYWSVRDPAAWRDGARRLLREVQRIKSEGDYAAAKKLFDAYGVKFEPALRDEVVARFQAQNLPAWSGFVQPRLRARFDGSDGGAIADVTIEYPCDLEQQMLEWSGRLQRVADCW
jgi:dipeptidyl-peptidase-3